MPGRSRVRALVAALAVLVGLGVLAAPAGSGTGATGGTAGSAAAAAPARTQVLLRAPARAARRPNIVLVLMDDFSMDLWASMRHGRRMAARGASYRNAYVVDSLCCVSRSSTLTGQYPHQTGVLLNTPNTSKGPGPLGGWNAFRAYRNGERSFNVRLRRGGYTTGYVGKFLNLYNPPKGGRRAVRPPGWSEWRPVFASAYKGWGFSMLRRDGRVQRFGIPRASASRATKDRTYAGTVISRTALDFIRRHRGDRRPWFLQVAPYATHNTVGGRAWRGEPAFPPAFADRPSPQRPGGNCGPVACRRFGASGLPAFGDRIADNRPYWGNGRRAPSWRPARDRVGRRTAATSRRNRARMAQSIDRMVGRIRRATGPNTYVVLTSDNGFHLGQHGMGKGKGLPYDSDVRVPLVVTGPGVARGTRREVVSNIDLAATFEDLAGVRTPAYRSGRSFAATLTDPALVRRRYAFFEHTWAKSLGDPDRSFAGGTMDRIPSYVAVRDRDGLLVRLDLDRRWSRARYAWEYYDYRDAPFERTNTFTVASKQADVRRLRRKLVAFLSCRSARRFEAVPRDCREVTR
jgi:arylsulfatase A-like enzyme